MSYNYGSKSKACYDTLHPLLQSALDDVLRWCDFAITTGVRSPQAQQDAFESGNSNKRGFNPDGSPYKYPHRIREDGYCWAADIIPIINGTQLDPKQFGVDTWTTSRWTHFLGRVDQAFFTRADEHRLKTGEAFRLRSGINWNRDAEILDEKDRRFIDAYHIEMEQP